MGHSDRERNLLLLLRLDKGLKFRPGSLFGYDSQSLFFGRKRLGRGEYVELWKR